MEVASGIVIFILLALFGAACLRNYDKDQQLKAARLNAELALEDVEKITGIAREWRVEHGKAAAENRALRRRIMQYEDIFPDSDGNIEEQKLGEA